MVIEVLAFAGFIFLLLVIATLWWALPKAVTPKKVTEHR